MSSDQQGYFSWFATQNDRATRWILSLQRKRKERELSLARKDSKLYPCSSECQQWASGLSEMQNLAPSPDLLNQSPNFKIISKWSMVMLEFEKLCSSRQAWQTVSVVTNIPYPASWSQVAHMTGQQAVSGRDLCHFWAETIQHEIFPFSHSGQQCSSWWWLHHPRSWREDNDNLKQSPHTEYCISSITGAWFSLCGVWCWGVMEGRHSSV